MTSMFGLSYTYIYYNIEGPIVQHKNDSPTQTAL